MSGYLGASGNGDDTCQEVSYHRFQRDSEAIHVDGVDQAQAVLFSQSGREGNTRSNRHLTTQHPCNAMGK